MAFVRIDYRKKSFKILVIVLVVLLLLSATVLILWEKFSITKVTVNGNSHYTEEEIKNMVFENEYCYNSIILSAKYNKRTLEDIPFIEKMDIEIVDPNFVRITVYEKAVAGYVDYLGHYMYFDKDGIIVESSNEIMEGVPFVTGLKFDHVVLHEQLPLKNKEIFLTILSITQLLNKYDIDTDRIAFDSSSDITLYFGNARVLLGNDDFIDEKINEMHLLLPKLQGYSGTLHMENYTGEESNFSFDMDKPEEEESESDEENSSDESSQEDTSSGEENQ